MRSLFALASVTALASLSACGGETCADGSEPVDDECPCSDGTYPSDNEGGVCVNDLDCAVSEVESNGECQFICNDGSLADQEADCPINLDPVAVGFEFTGAFDGTTIVGPTTDGETIPIVIMTFANADFFGSGGNEEGDGNSCEAVGVFDTIVGESVLDVDGATVWTTFDTTMSIRTDLWADDDLSCGVALDPEIWGENGEDLLAAFTRFRFGLGFGPMTPYLLEAFQNDEGEFINGWDVFGDAFVASYIGLNLEDGTFVLEDWTASIPFEWNSTTGEIAEDEEGLLIPIDMTNATEMPVSYIQSTAYWYQDFPLLDLSNLGDGRPLVGDTDPDSDTDTQ